MVVFINTGGRRGGGVALLAPRRPPGGGRDGAGARRSYNKMFVAYLRTFARMGLTSIPMRADTGPIGGNLSHEFIILAETGESQVFVSRDLLERDVLAEAPDYDSDLTAQVDFWTSHYAATEEMHDEAAWAALSEDKRVSARGIEVGHIFYFGTKYSAAMGMAVTEDGTLLVSADNLTLYAYRTQSPRPASRARRERRRPAGRWTCLSGQPGAAGQPCRASARFRAASDQRRA